jgi:hypothetical protein
VAFRDDEVIAFMSDYLRRQRINTVRPTANGLLDVQPLDVEARSLLPRGDKASSYAVGGLMALEDDKLLAVIRRYESELAAINASVDLSDEELDAWVDRTDATLVEAAGLPALTAASALAALDLVATEGQVDSHSIYGARFLELVRAARNYIASTVQA